MPTAVNQSDGGNLGQVVAASLNGEKGTRHVRAKYPPVSVGREHRTDCKVCHDFTIAVAELDNQMNESRSKAKAVESWQRYRRSGVRLTRMEDITADMMVNK
jgi:hypothetical protein